MIFRKKLADINEITNVVGNMLYVNQNVKDPKTGLREDRVVQRGLTPRPALLLGAIMDECRSITEKHQAARQAIDKEHYKYEKVDDPNNEGQKIEKLVRDPETDQPVFKTKAAEKKHAELVEELNETEYEVNFQRIDQQILDQLGSAGVIVGTNQMRAIRFLVRDLEVEAE